MSEKESKKDGLADVLKKVVSMGTGAAFLTEDAVKNLLKDVPLPKDVLGGLMDNAKGTKEELVTALREELGKYFSRLDLNKVVDYIAENYDVEVKASFNFKKKKTEEKSESSSSKSKKS